MNIFISYNHKDKYTALKIKDTLANADFEVTIDVEKMKAGQAIEQFIYNSIRNTDVTLILISRNSLASAWVALEFIISNIDELLSARKIIPCYLDADFFDYSFTSRVTQTIDQNITKINDLIHTALNKHDGIEDLQNELTRLREHKTHLPSIIKRFRETLCIDFTADNFKEGIARIIYELKSDSYTSDPLSKNGKNKPRNMDPKQPLSNNKYIPEHDYTQDRYGEPLHKRIIDARTAEKDINTSRRTPHQYTGNKPFIQTDWDNLLSEIARGNCALFLGHGLLADKNGLPMYNQICDKLANELKSLLHTYYPEENFFLFNELKNRRKFSNRIENFYRGLTPDLEMYRMLAEIPVSLYISVSPDNFLQKALEDRVNISFFNDRREKMNEVEATIDKPFIYNIFGSIQDSGSLLLSHDDLFAFFKDVLSGKGLPTAVKKFFREDAGGEVIFLGFTFSKWYVQLLLRLFNLTQNNQLGRTAYLHHTPLVDDITFANQHFRVEFIETEVREFIYELHKRCKENNLLRDLKNNNKIPESKEDQINKITLRLKKCHDLRQQSELSLMLEDDARLKIKYQKDIETLEKEITKLSQELITLSV